MNNILTPEEIAHKYVHGEHDALTDTQEKKDMAEDIRRYADSQKEEGFEDGANAAANDIAANAHKMF